MSSSAQTPACSQTCPMVDPEVSSEFFRTIGHIKGRVDAIHDDLHVGPEAIDARVKALELAQAASDGRKQERRDRRTVLVSLAGAFIALMLGIANYLKH